MLMKKSEQESGDQIALPRKSKLGMKPSGVPLSLPDRIGSVVQTGDVNDNHSQK